MLEARSLEEHNSVSCSLAVNMAQLWNTQKFNVSIERIICLAKVAIRHGTVSSGAAFGSLTQRLAEELTATSG